MPAVAPTGRSCKGLIQLRIIPTKTVGLYPIPPNGVNWRHVCEELP